MRDENISDKKTHQALFNADASSMITLMIT